jgi:glutamine amidotransferase-like uncharacterized protein/effector-binding domain-containing protein
MILFFSALAFAEPAVNLEIIPSRVEAVVSQTGPYGNLGDIFANIETWISDYGWHPTERGVALLLSNPTAVPPHLLKSEATIPLNVYGNILPVVPPNDYGLSLRDSEPILVLSTEQMGPYDAFAPAYARLHRAMANYNLSFTGVSRELYHNSPINTDDKDLRTSVQIIVEPIGKADVGVYVGNGGFDSGVVAASHAFAAAGLSIRPITPEQINSGKLKKLVRVLYMPGGWAAPYVNEISDKGAQHLTTFIEKGGGYIGVCAGSYYAGKQIRWEEETFDYDLDLFPGTPTGPVVQIKPWPEFALTPISLNTNHPITTEQPATIQGLYYGGPAFLADEGADVTVIGTFDVTNEPAIVAFNKGKGRVFLSSVHLEYDLTSTDDATAWPEELKGFEDPESDWGLLQSATRWILAD